MLLDVPAELSTLPSLGYDLNPRSLRQTMLLRQRDLHPDKFAVSGDKAVELAKELSGRVNDAYAVLSDPLRRAEYIVSISARVISYFGDRRATIIRVEDDCGAMGVESES